MEPKPSATLTETVEEFTEEAKMKNATAIIDGYTDDVITGVSANPGEYDTPDDENDYVAITYDAEWGAENAVTSGPFGSQRQFWDKDGQYPPSNIVAIAKRLDVAVTGVLTDHEELDEDEHMVAIEVR